MGKEANQGAWVVKIKVNRRYLTRDDEIAFVTKSLPNGFYYTLVDSSNILMCDLTGKHQSHKHLDLVAPYKPRKREPKVGDEIIYKVRGIISDIPKSRVGVCVMHKTYAPQGQAQEIEVRLDTRDIVRFLNKDKV